MAVDKGVNFSLKATYKAAGEFRRLQGDLKKTQSEGKAAAESAKTFQREIDRLTGKFNPAAAAAMRTEREIKDLNRAFTMGVVDARQYKAQLDVLRTAQTRLQQQSRLTTVANKRFAESLGGSTWRRQVQQAGMQISDFSVQVAGGQSAILAFTQNAPQFVQNFGAMGGVLAAVITILGTFAFSMQRSGQLARMFGSDMEQTRAKTEAFKETAEKLSGVVSDFKSSIEAARAPLSELRSDFGTMATEGQKLLQMQARLNQIFAERAVGKAFRQMSTALNAGNFAAIRPEVFTMSQEALDRYTAALENHRNSLVATYAESDRYSASVERRIDIIDQELIGIKRLDGNITALAERFGIAEGEAMRIARAIGEVSRAQGIVEQGEAARKLAAEIYEVTDRLGLADDEAALLWESLLEAAAAATRVEGNSDAAAAAISGAADAAARLAENLRIAAGRRMDALVGGNVDFFDPRNEAGLSGVIMRERPNPQPEYRRRLEREASRAARGGGGGRRRSGGRARSGGGGGRTAISQAQRELDAFNESLADTHPALRRMLEGVTSSTLEAAQKIKTQFEQVQSAIESSLTSAFEGLLDGSKSLADATRDILSAILKQIINIVTQPLIKSLAGNITSAIFGGLGKGISSFEGGGLTGAGARAGGLDGRGGRLAMVHPDEEIIDYRKGGSSRGATTVNMYITTPNADSFRRSERQIARRAQRAIGG